MGRLCLIYLPPLLLLGACVPIPTIVNDSPKIEGALTSNGLPVADKKLLVCVSFYAEPKCEESTTNSQGKFYLEGRKKLGFVSMGDPSYELELKTTNNGQPLNWNVRRMGGIPSNAALKCEISERLSCDYDVPR